MKILLAAPTSEAKNYCFHAYHTLIKAMCDKYGYEFLLVDNSKGDANRQMYYDLKMNYTHVEPVKNETSQSFICRSQNVIRDYFLNSSHNFTHLAMLETDLLPSVDVFERLYGYNLPIVGAPYLIGKNITTHAMIQDMVDNGNAHFTVRTLKAHNAIPYFTGDLKRAYSIGFGCVLIERAVIEAIPFRWESDGSVINNQISDAHSDSFFYADCFRKDIPVFLDTSRTIRHYNSKWLN